MDITYRSDHGILVIEPTGKLEDKDFENLATELDNIRKDDRKLNGLLIHTKDFPGYEKFSDVLTHGEFVKEHKDRIGKVALCTDSKAGGLAEILTKNFTDVDVKKFDYDNKDEAEKWLLG